MYQFFTEPSNINDKSVIIEGSDVNHIKNVLRIKPGEEISVSNGIDGREYRCEVVSLSDDRVECRIRFIKEDNVELPNKVYLFQGYPKGVPPLDYDGKPHLNEKLEIRNAKWWCGA